MTADEVAKSDEQAYAKICTESLQAPLLVSNYMQFGNLKMRFNTNMLVVYCNPDVHGQETYDKVLAALCEARRKRPLSIKPNEDGDVSQ